MIVNLLKFFHLLCALSLLGMTLFCFTTLSRQPEQISLVRFNKTMLILAFFAMLTGTLLVYPKHFTFHTPWIQAAYVLVTIYTFVIGAMIIFAKKKFGLRFIYLSLLVILILVVHDAVTKTTFLFK